MPPAKSEKAATLPAKTGVEGGNVATEKASPPAANDERDDLLSENANTITEMAAEIESLRAQVAVGALPTEDQPSATEIIEHLRTEVKALEAENTALRSSRDHYQREASELRKQIKMNERELKRARAA